MSYKYILGLMACSQIVPICSSCQICHSRGIKLQGYGQILFKSIYPIIKKIAVVIVRFIVFSSCIMYNMCVISKNRVSTTGCVLMFSILFVVTFPFGQGELDNWEDYPVILTMEYDKAIFLTPGTGCHVVEDRRLMEKFLIRKNNVFRTNSTNARDIIMLCQDFQSDKINATQFVIKLHEKSFLIYPGTHFCGVGNNANNETDLGYYQETDICCREHDSCTNSVSGWSCHENITELCNWAPFTRSHCDCDDTFRECLQQSTETAAYTIGTLFFSVFGLKCFKEDYPIIQCDEYGGFLNIHCQKYRLDYTKEPLYQFFDSPKFAPGTRSVASNFIHLSHDDMFNPNQYKDTNVTKEDSRIPSGQKYATAQQINSCDQRKCNFTDKSYVTKADNQ